MSYLQAIVIAFVQGATELFPVSSLGHSVLVPAWIGGSWQTLVTQSSQPNSESSFYLAFIVALHCATALVLLWFFRADWSRIIRGFIRSVRRSVGQRRVAIEGTEERLAWMVIIATIPVGLTGVVLEHTFRTLLAKPVATSAFLFINGLILLAGERFRRRAVRDTVATGVPAAATDPTVGTVARGETAPTGGARRSGGRSRADLSAARRSDGRIVRLGYRNAGYIGILQIAALCAGISRDGITMVGGLWRGLDSEDSARFAFLLATPPILAAGLLKLPSLAGSAGAHIHGQVIVGVLVTAVTAYLSVRFLMRYFKTRTLTPFAIYCLVAGSVSLIHFA